MPNTIVSQGRNAPWVGVGVSGEWTSSMDALADAGLNFTVRQERLFWNKEEQPGSNISYQEPAPMFANVRDTDNTLLGCVTPQYKIIQNEDAFALIDPLLGNNGIITHAGMTCDGLCFMVAEIGSKLFGNETYKMNLMLTNSFNAKFPCQIIMTPIRIICQNMYRKVVNDKVFLAKHTVAASDRIKAIANSNAIEKKALLFGEVIEQFQSHNMSKRKLEALIAAMFPYPKEGGPREIAYKARTDKLRESFVDQYFDAPDNRQHQGTSFGFVNAYFDYLSHREPARETGVSWESRRLSGLISGLDVNSHLLKEAMK